MGGIQGNKKYVLLYGPKGSGKSTLLYSQISTIKLFEPMEPTKGINYEELNINNQNIGVFEVAGDLQQTNLISVVTSSVKITGIIYVINISHIENLDLAKMQLKIVLSDPNLDEYFIHLFVIYNLKQNDKDKLSWISNSALDEGLGLKKIEEKFHLKSLSTTIYDCNTNNSEVKDEHSLASKMKEFIENLFK